MASSVTAAPPRPRDGCRCRFPRACSFALASRRCRGEARNGRFTVLTDSSISTSATGGQRRLGPGRWRGGTVSAAPGLIERVALDGSLWSMAGATRCSTGAGGISTRRLAVGCSHRGAQRCRPGRIPSARAVRSARACAAGACGGPAGRGGRRAGSLILGSGFHIPYGLRLRPGRRGSPGRHRGPRLPDRLGGRFHGLRHLTTTSAGWLLQGFSFSGPFIAANLQLLIRRHEPSTRAEARMRPPAARERQTGGFHPGSEVWKSVTSVEESGRWYRSRPGHAPDADQGRRCRRAGIERQAKGHPSAPRMPGATLRFAGRPAGHLRGPGTGRRPLLSAWRRLLPAFWRRARASASPAGRPSSRPRHDAKARAAGMTRPGEGPPSFEHDASRLMICDSAGARFRIIRPRVARPAGLDEPPGCRTAPEGGIGLDGQRAAMPALTGPGVDRGAATPNQVFGLVVGKACSRSSGRPHTVTRWGRDGERTEAATLHEGQGGEDDNEHDLHDAGVQRVPPRAALEDTFCIRCRRRSGRARPTGGSGCPTPSVATLMSLCAPGRRTPAGSAPAATAARP